jgi:hypothetical protein
LQRAIRKAGVPCHVQGDGGSVRISQHLMYCGRKLPNIALEAPNPVESTLTPSPRGMVVCVAELFAAP